MQRGARVVRIIGLVVATAAAAAVFDIGGRDGGTDWQVPALVLIGVLVVILHSATSVQRRSEPTAPSPPTNELRGTSVSIMPSSAPGSFVPGLPTVQIPPGSFPDPGHSHGPVIAIHEQQPPPPLHEVLRPPQEGPPSR